MKPSVARLFERFYPAATYRDEDVLLDEAILRAIRPDSCVLDAGAGAGELYDKDYRPLCREVIGVDLDERVLTNRRLSRGIVGSLEAIPLPDASVDLVFCRYVFEHLDEPARTAREFARVLRPGGTAIVMTPSRLHYVTLAAAVTPLWFHQLYNKWRGRKTVDTFPTRYRANTKRALTHLFEAEGLRATRVAEIETAPNYLTLFSPTFIVGVGYERVVNRFDALSRFRVLLLGEFAKLPG